MEQFFIVGGLKKLFNWCHFQKLQLGSRLRYRQEVAIEEPMASMGGLGVKIIQQKFSNCGFWKTLGAWFRYHLFQHINCYVFYEALFETHFEEIRPASIIVDASVLLLSKIYIFYQNDTEQYSLL